jgi:uncharacterized protein (DUF952 family)
MGDDGSMIFHIARRQDWEAAQVTGSYAQSTLDRTLAEEGFIHASHRDQVDDVLARYYEGIDDLVLLAISPEGLTAEVRDEPATPGSDEVFPHIYGPIPVAAVVEVTDL